MLRVADTLRVVYPAMAREEIRRDAGDGGKWRDVRAEQFNGHDNGSYRRVCCARKHRDKSQAREHREGQMQKGSQGVAERCTDVKKGSDLAALESRSKRSHREQQFA